MNKTLAFTKLDFITVKPYLTLKNLLLFSLVAVIMSLTVDSPVSVIGMLMVYASLFASYPFVLGEKSGIDILYATLSIKRSTVVLGRYLFAAAMLLLGGLLAYTVSFLMNSFMRNGFDYAVNLAILGGVFFVLSVMQAVQLPLYFKLDYTKAKIIVYIPFALIPIIVLLFNTVLKDYFTQEQTEALVTWVTLNPVSLVLVGLAAYLLIQFVSLKISFAFYKKKDF